MLTDAKVRALKAKPKPYKVSDSGGLHILVMPSGTKAWRQAYRYAGKQRTAAHGIYPQVSLSDARARRDDTKRLLRQGQDPGAVVKAERAAIVNAAAATFRAVANEWFQRKMVAERKSESTLARAQWLIDILNEGIGDRVLSEIEAPDLLPVLRRVRSARTPRNRQTAASYGRRHFPIRNRRRRLQAQSGGRFGRRVDQCHFNAAPRHHRSRRCR